MLWIFRLFPDQSEALHYIQPRTVSTSVVLLYSVSCLYDHTHICIHIKLMSNIFILQIYTKHYKQSVKVTLKLFHTEMQIMKNEE